MNNDMSNMSINGKDFIEKFEELKKENARLKQERENFIHQSNAKSVDQSKKEKKMAIKK